MELPLDRILCCDCMEGLRNLPCDCIDCVVTSPPYNKGKQGEKVGNQIWGGFKIEYDVYADKMDDAEYAAWMVAVLTELHRVVRSDGSVFVNHKVILEGCKGRFPKWILDTPFDLYQMIVWDRCCSCNIRKETFFPTYELVFWLTKGKPRTFKEQTAYRNDIWRIRPEMKSDHPAPFPFDLAENCIRMACRNGDGCVVLDPFMGSGTTAVAAKENGHHFIGFELSPQYVQMANDRLSRTTRKGFAVQGNLF